MLAWVLKVCHAIIFEIFEIYEKIEFLDSCVNPAQALGDITPAHMGHDPDYNPYCLPKRYRNKFPRDFVGGQPCMEEFNALFDCLVMAKFDKQPCEEANRQVNNCMVANV